MTDGSDVGPNAAVEDEDAHPAGSTGRYRVLVAGGGTAGHVLPGIAVANTLVVRGVDRRDIHFVGARGGIEERLVGDADFEITLLPGRGIQRRLTVQNIRAIWGLIKALFMAFGIVRRFRPTVVLGLGGFASAACSFAAVVTRTPLVIAEQNARAGAVNRLTGRFAKACAVPFPDVDLPRTVITGNPVRPEIIEAASNLDREAARVALDLPNDRTVILAFAGSLGSTRINDAVWGALETWQDRSDLSIYHVIGARDWDRRPEHPAGELDYRPVRYEDRMDLALSAADLAVCRAGGTTVAELAVIGLPAVLVPLPIATRDHQRYNAMALVDAGGAVCVTDSEFDTARLVASVSELLPDLEDRAAALRTSAKPDAADRVADLVLEAARR